MIIGRTLSRGVGILQELAVGMYPLGKILRSVQEQVLPLSQMRYSEPNNCLMENRSGLGLISASSHMKMVNLKCALDMAFQKRNKLKPEKHIIGANESIDGGYNVPWMYGVNRQELLVKKLSDKTITASPLYGHERSHTFVVSSDKSELLKVAKERRGIPVYYKGVIF